MRWTPPLALNSVTLRSLKESRIIKRRNPFSNACGFSGTSTQLSCTQKAESATKVLCLMEKKCKNLYCVNRGKVIKSAPPFGDTVEMVRRNMVSIVCRVSGILGKRLIEKFFTNQKLPLYTSQIQGDLLILTPSKTFSQTTNPNSKSRRRTILFLSCCYL